ncbi:ribosome maturation factor RimP [Anaerosporobacter sp.]|uniref:ribosome maturation factor RimP n=1 Tax=Anaerosporobacter sp. TaxID=1872529 RepID=UPI00286F6A1F|nr:ribosome maturation factor RimP [Anaerosporobacter sp.]
MARREEYEAITERLLEPILEENNFELYDIEYVKEVGNWYLRVYIDKEDGITIDDCELVSRALNDLLDEKDFISDAYIFEVSSPGLGRQLKKDKHFAKSIGEEVEIKLYKAIDKKKEFDGILTAFDKDTITIEIEEDNTMVLNRSEIAMVRLALDF